LNPTPDAVNFARILIIKILIDLSVVLGRFHIVCKFLVLVIFHILVNILRRVTLKQLDGDVTCVDTVEFSGHVLMIH
jgi:hypothetical protein